jgi:hypothetical protein
MKMEIRDISIVTLWHALQGLIAPLVVKVLKITSSVSHARMMVLFISE